MAIGKETERKLFHMAAGVVLSFLVAVGIAGVWYLAAVTLGGLLLSLVVRRKRVPVVGWLLARLERGDDATSFPGRGAFFFFCGALVSVALFPRDVASASIMVLAMGDSISPMVSRRLGGRRVMGRPVAGSAAGFVASFAGAALFLPVHEALVASLAGMAIETVDTFRGRRIEDNVTIPLASGFVVLAMRACIPLLFPASFSVPALPGPP